jgi:hypothetical protein
MNPDAIAAVAIVAIVFGSIVWTAALASKRAPKA